MNESRDIYKTSEKESREQKDLPLVEMTPNQVRSRTLRTSVGFTLVMLVLLGGSTWFIYQQEKQSNLPESGTGLESPFDQALQTNTPGSTRIAIPEPVVSLSQPTDLQIEPEKMAQAMGEARIANDYLRVRDFDKAEIHARKALDVWPDMNAALRLLGVIYTQRGQFDQAIAILEKARTGSPFSVEIYNNLATAFMQKGDYDKAEELLQTSLQISPGYRVAFLNLGLVSLLRAQYEAAADYLERALEQVPDDPPPRNNLAVALIRLGRYEDARKSLQMIVDLHPELPNVYFNMAITYVLENRFPEAMDWIRRGAQRCSPVMTQQYLADNDFNAIRGTPEYQKFVETLYPDLPQPPQG